MANEEKIMLGIDVGASGMKGALVDLEKGTQYTERLRIPTPKPATPKAMAKVFKEIVDHFDYSGPIGCGFPSIMKNGVARSAANIDKSWIGTDAEKLFSEITGCKVSVLNDADVAGVAEMKFGAGKGEQGVVLMITLGSGLGSALFVDQKLVPNTEFGHFFLKGHKQVAEKYASENARKDAGLDWKEWSGRFNEYLKLIERLFTPDLIILGGGGSKKFNKFEEHLIANARIKPAELLNRAGIVGAAHCAWEVDQVAV